MKGRREEREERESDIFECLEGRVILLKKTGE